MDIELKKIRHSPSLSQETEAFTGDLYINGTHAAIASNRGTGGPTYYQAISEEGKKLVREAETYCAALPPTQSTEFEGLEYPMDLEQFINDLLYAHLKEKDLAQFNRKLERAMEKGIVYGKPDHSFQQLVLQTPPVKLLTLRDGAIKLVGIIKRNILPKLKDGIIVLNNNIPENIYQEAGLTDTQYRKGSYQFPQQQKVNKNAKHRKP